MLEVVQEEDKLKCSKDLNYIKLSLSNLRVGHSQLMLDLPLDYHTEDFDNAFMELVDQLEDLINCSVKDFSSVRGIGEKTSVNIYEFIHKKED